MLRMVEVADGRPIGTSSVPAEAFTVLIVIIISVNGVAIFHLHSSCKVWYQAKCGQWKTHMEPMRQNE